MQSLVILFLLTTVVVGQQQSSQALPCGFSCTRRAVISAFIDGQPGTATCSQNTSPSRCEGCCIGRALQDGIASTSATGFISNDGRSCVCCFNKPSCGGNTFIVGRK